MSGRAVTAVVVHYRSGGDVLACVRDLLNQGRSTLDVHVVECGDDGSVARMAPSDRVTVHRPGRNLGYAGGNDYGACLADPSTHLLLVNPDIRMPDSGTVAALLDVLAEHPQAGAAAPLLKRGGGFEYTGSRWDDRTGRAVHTGGGATVWPHFEDAVRLPWLNGACVLLRRSAWDKIGELDRRYFLYFEEVDWCLRAGRLGIPVLLTGRVEVEHSGSASFVGTTKGAYYAVRNRHLLARTHARGHRWRVHWARETAQVFRARPDQRTAVLRGALHAITGRTGAMPGDDGSDQ